MSIEDSDVLVKQPFNGAVERTQHFKNADSISVKDFGAVGNGVYVSLTTAYGTLAAAQVAFPGVYLDAASMAESVDWAAIQAALNTGKKVIVPKGDYCITQELEMKTPGQVLSFENTGGYAYGLDALTEWSSYANTRFIAYGNNFRKVIRTHRKHRASASSPKDAPFSTVINVQAEGVVLEKVCIWLNGNYEATDTTASLGDDVDVGIFVGTRCGFQAHDVQVLGYFRLAGIYLDVSSAHNLPRFNQRNGTAYPQGSTRNSGDGTHLHNPYILGARQGLAILGAVRSAGAAPYYYYDESFGTGPAALTVADGRGSVGFSDFVVVGGQIYGPDHHSLRRLKDPALVGGVLSSASMDSEPDDAPCAVHIDGISANSSDSIWGLRFIGTRIASFEAFRMRLGRVDRLSLIDCHIEGRNAGILSTTGDAVDSNNYTLYSYGDIAGQDITGRVKVYGSVRPNLDTIGPHFYGETLHAVTDFGITYAGGFISGSRNKDLDLRAWTGKQIFMRIDDVPQVWVSTNGLRSLNGLQVGSGSGPRIDSGSVVPEGVVTAAKGSLYLCTHASSGGLYVKQSASGNTGWVLK